MIDSENKPKVNKKGRRVLRVPSPATSVSPELSNVTVAEAAAKSVAN